jgi:uncharacterized protein YukE
MMYGSDPDELDQLAAELGGLASQIDHGTQRLRATLHGVAWNGPGADAFRARWDQRHHPRLLSTAAFLRDSSGRLRRNASEQRTASRSDSATGPWRYAHGTAPSVMSVITGFDGAKFIDTIKGYGDGMLSVISTSERIRLLSHLTDLDPSAILKHYGHNINLTKNAHLGVLGALGMMLTTAQLMEAAATGNVDQMIRKGIDLAWTGAGQVFPPAGWAKGAWDGGYFVGATVANFGDKVFHTTDNIVGNGIARTYRSDLSEVQNATNLTNRYKGWRGFGNSIVDLIPG